MNHKILFIKNSEIKKIFKLKIKNFIKAEIISAIAEPTRFIIKRAGSGHLGTSFSAMDLFVWIKLLDIKLQKIN